MESFLQETRKVGRGSEGKLPSLTLALPSSARTWLRLLLLELRGMRHSEELSMKEASWCRAPVYLGKDSSCQRRLQ